MRTKLIAGLALTAVIAAPAVAHADGGGSTPFIQFQAANTGQVQDLQAGTSINLNYMDPSGRTTATQYCWSPPAVGQPACTSSNFGVLSEPGTQTITAQLSNGRTVTTSFPVYDANGNTPAAAATTYKRTIKLRPNTTFTYHLKLPTGFQASSKVGVNYSVYPTSGPGYAVSSPIGSGRQPSYLGVSVLGTSFNGNDVAVTVKTGKLAQPMTLRLAARGTVA